MESKVPDIFDRDLRRQRLLRVRSNFAAADFLLKRMAQDINERLQDIKREFNNVLVIVAHEGICEQMPALISKARNITLRRTVPLGDDFIDEENPDLEARSFDLIISLGGLHSINDLLGCLIQMKLALKPDGLLLGALIGGETLYELRQSFMQAETEIENGVRPHIHPFIDMQNIGTLLQRAGYNLPVIDYDRVIVRYETALHLLRDLRLMGETNILKKRRRTPLRRQTLMRMGEIYHREYGAADGKIPARFDLIYLSGWSPHESQPTPLKPGSAKMSLAAALNSNQKNR